MSFEFLVYLFVVMYGLLGVFIKKNQNVYFFVCYLLLVFWSLIVRNSGFDVDMKLYSEYVEYGEFSYSLYYLKEPFFWYSSIALFRLIDNVPLVFVVLDSSLFFILIYLARSYSLPLFLPVLWVCFFSSFMAMQNVYRQFFCMNFMLFSLLLFMHRRLLFAWIFFALAVLSHNVALIFFPVIYVFFNKGREGLLFYLFSFSILVLLPYFSSYKSHSDTGNVPPSLFLLIIFFLLSFFILVNKFRITMENRKVVVSMFYLLFISIDAVIVMGGGQAKRIAMISLSLIVFYILFFLREKLSKGFEGCLYILMITPTVIFSSSRSLM